MIFRGMRVQICDIDTSDSQSWNSGEGFIPIGSSSSRFTGSYDGNGFSISNLHINRLANYQGLFGNTQNASLSNINLIEVNVNVNENNKVFVGGVVGMALNTTITNCSCDGNISAGQYTGGIVGLTDANSIITNCCNTSTVDGDRYVGGIAGTTSNTDVSKCYNQGNIS